MKLLECTIENYGKWHKTRFVFNGSLTCVCLQNGEGKSTLASFLKAMLYGLESERDNATEKGERSLYYPFSGGAFGGTLTVEWRGERYLIERFFDKMSKKKDTLCVYDGANRQTNALGECVGETLFGLPVEAFERTAFIGAEHTDISLRYGIGERLGRLNLSSGTVEEAVAALKAKRQELRSDRRLLGKYTGKIPQTEEKLVALQQEIFAIEQDEKRLGEAYRTEAELCAVERGQSEIVRTQARLQERNAPIKRGGRWRSLVWAVAFTLLLIGAASCFFEVVLGVGLLAAGALTLLAALFFAIGKREGNAQRSAELARELDEKTAENAGVLSRYGVSTWEEVRSLLSDMRRLVSELESRVVSLPQKRQELSETEAELFRLKEEAEIIDATIAALLEAARRLNGKYLQPMTESFLRYLSLLGADFIGGVALDGDLKVYFESGGARRSSEHLSDGQKSVVELCMRLALLENTYGGELPFCILDDPFLYLDERNLAFSKNALLVLKDKLQIVYFCCHE